MSDFEFMRPVFSSAGVSGPKADYSAALLKGWAANAGLGEAGRPFSAQVEKVGGAVNVLISGPWGDGQPYIPELGDRIAEWGAADKTPAAPPNPDHYRQIADVAQVSLIETVQAPDLI